MNTQPTAYALIWSRMVPHGPITGFKKLLMFVGAILVLGALWVGFSQPNPWGLLGGLMGGALVIFRWAKRLANIPKLTSADLSRRVAMFRQLKNKDWEPAMSELQTQVERYYTVHELLANPLTWNRKQRVVLTYDGPLKITLYERDGVVGQVKLVLSD